MNYLFVAPSYTPVVGGAQSFQREMVRRLVAGGNRVTVLTTVASEPADFWRPPAASAGVLCPQEIIDGAEVHRLSLGYPWPAPYAFGILRRLGHWLHRLRLPLAVQRPALSFLARWMPPLPGLAAALREFVPGADLVQATDSSWDGLFTATARAVRVYRKPFVAVPLMHLGAASVRAHFQMVHQVDAYRNANAVVALSRTEANAYERLGVEPARTHILAMGVTAEVTPLPNNVASFKERNGLKGPLVAFMGANTYDKGAFTLAQAVARLNSAGRPVDLVCAGSQPEQLVTYLQEQSRQVQSALENRVHLLGIVDENTKRSLLDACDLLALPSQVDTFGIVLLEAWLHGKPVIGANAGGIPDLIEHEKTGLLVPFDDAQALADGIRRLLVEPGLATRLGAEGRQRVLTRYTWDATYRELQKIYSAAVTGQPHDR